MQDVQTPIGVMRAKTRQATRDNVGGRPMRLSFQSFWARSQGAGVCIEHYIGHAGVCSAERRSKLMAEARHDMVIIYFKNDFAVFCMQGARTSITTDLGENEYNEAEDNVGTR